MSLKMSVSSCTKCIQNNLRKLLMLRYISSFQHPRTTKLIFQTSKNLQTIIGFSSDVSQKCQLLLVPNVYRTISESYWCSVAHITSFQHPRTIKLIFETSKNLQTIIGFTWNVSQKCQLHLLPNTEQPKKVFILKIQGNKNVN